jgi:hypothetical protein
VRAPFRARIAAGSIVLLTLVAGRVVTQTPQPPPPPVQEPSSRFIPTSVRFAAPVMLQFQADVRAKRPTTLALASPTDTNQLLRFTFDAIDGPVPRERARGLLFARGRDVTGRRIVRVTIVSAVRIELTLFDDNGYIYQATVRPDLPIRYERITSSSDAAGRVCFLQASRRAAAFERAVPFAALVQTQARMPHTVPASIRTLRLAVAVTAELYHLYHERRDKIGDDIIALVNASNEVFEEELHVSLTWSSVLHIAGNEVADANGSLALGDGIESFFAMESADEHDLGHLFGVGDGGYGKESSLCSPLSKSSGFTLASKHRIKGLQTTFMHEIGHQLGAPHSFNAANDFRNPEGAYEPDLGASLMSYATEPVGHFHSSSIDFIRSNLESGSEASKPSCGNTPVPTATVSGTAVVSLPTTDWHVPLQTPFAPDAGTPAPGQSLRWDEHDLATAPDNAPPYFVWDGPTGTYSLFPSLGHLATPPASLHWPAAGETLTFRVLNFAGSSLRSWQDVSVHIEPGPPFTITSLTCPQNKCVQGGTLTVLLQGPDTTKAPYNVKSLTADVIDNGRVRASFPDLANQASVVITLPQKALVNARLVIRATGGGFAAVSAPFSIK